MLRALPGWLSLSLFCASLCGDNRGYLPFDRLDKAGDSSWLMVVMVRPSSTWAHEGSLGKDGGRSLSLHWLFGDQHPSAQWHPAL